MNRKSNVTVSKVAQAACDMYFIGVVIVDLSFGTLICDQSYEDGTQGFEIIPLEERTPQWLGPAQGKRRSFHPLESRRGPGSPPVKPTTNGRMTTYPR